MAARIRTIDFLPEIFQTPTNRQFLGATLDQMVQEPKLKPTQGYIGRRVGPGVDPNDSYVLEPDSERTNYQLEPGVVFLKDQTNIVEDAVSYPGLLDSLSVQGANTTRQDRLFKNEYYSWDPFIDLDKFVNFGQYYWLPEGPDSVDVQAAAVPITDEYAVTRSDSGYEFEGLAGNLPTITLVRQGSYEFEVNQLGHGFWIQSVPGTSGVLPQTPNQSSREVLGVVNNGDDVGTVTFNVPSKSAQNFFFTLADAGTVSFATDLKFNQVNNQFVNAFFEEHDGIDGIRDIDGRTIIFLNQNDVEEGGWYFTSQFDTENSGYDETVFDQETPISTLSQRYSVWRINLIYDENNENPYIRLTVAESISNLSKLRVEYGATYADIQFYKDAEGYFQRIPLITANADVLYYQDGTSENSFGVIRLIDTAGEQNLDIDDILGKTTYTSPNGVVFTNGLKVQFQGLTTPSSYEGNEYYVEGVGSSIQLLPVTDFITPEQYTRSRTEPYDSVPYDEAGYDDTLNAPLDVDYFSINRSSLDLNPWTRSNRWFHIDVINATAAYNNVDPVVDNDYRAKRPIIEFRPSLKLYNFGTQGVGTVDIIDFVENDAFSNVNGTIGYSVDGYTLIEGSRIIFAADTDASVRNRIYEVRFVDFEDSTDKVIDLQPADITIPGNRENQSVTVTSGVTSQGNTYYYNGNSWQSAQQKIKVNQAPLFDVYDSNGISYSNSTVYPGTSFAGTKLFSYAVGSGPEDSILGQSLKYLTISNVGDIVFENNLYTDTFVYVDGTISVTGDIDDGVIRQYTSLTDYTSLIGWQTAFTQETSRQSYSYEYEGVPLVLDVQVNDASSSRPVKVFVNGQFVLPTTYTYTTNNEGVTVITFTATGAPEIGSIVEVSVMSTSAGSAGYYTVPDNLQNNAVNGTPNEITLGTIRNHYNSVCQNLEDFSGVINGSNNTRDLGNIIPYGENIVQQSSPLTFASLFSYDNNFNFFNAIEWNGQEYQKFKNILIDTVINNEWGNFTASEILDGCFQLINQGKNENSPFYWTDMIPCGSTFDETTYTITPISTRTFDTLRTYDFTSANYAGILVYLNDSILLGDGHEYTVADDGPRIIIADSVDLVNGDVITIREYTSTYGSFVPNTPSKLGLYPVYEPEQFVDNTYRTPQTVILGHDGSKTIAWGDIRDEVLLEFEKRVYSNVKVPNRYEPSLQLTEILPGQFRDTDYNLSEITEILSESFLSWVGWNKLPYRTQTYNSTDSFTWNYSNSENKLDGSILLGGWRAIYNYLYDTDSPHTTPWEMLGFTERPDWWNTVYGPAPYTSGNTVLWEDLRDGKVADPAGEYTISDRARPRMLEIIPTDSEGNLLSPFDVVVGEYDQGSFQKSWTVGDQGEVETAWRRSSSYPFAVQRLLALTRPAKYFSLFADNDLYKRNTVYNQYLFNNRFRITTDNLEIYGNDVPKHSYINFIIDYNRIAGLDSTSELETLLQNIDVRLIYRMAAFSDQRYLKIYTEKSSPNSLNSSLLLPDESYQIKLYKNPVFDEVLWSSVIIQRTTTGYTVYGYSTTKPYFPIVNSLLNGRYTDIRVADTTVRAAIDHGNRITKVPYGYEFATINSVVDFLLSYGAYMDRKGLIFENTENNRVLNWRQMAQEFIYWSKQGWAAGSLININPLADRLELNRPGAVVESVAGGNALLNQNRRPVQGRDYVTERYDNVFALRAFNNETFSYLNARFTSYEHILVFDNTSIFNDLIYDPKTGNRQSRLRLEGYTTYDWNGTLDAQGFILNQDNVEEWQPNTSYSKGELVLYKDDYWSAGGLIPPKETFDFNDWIKSDYDKITKGLLPNLATKSDLIRNYYDTNTANLETDADLMAFGLIGFRPRQYMQNLNLSDISQVNLYQQFLGTKGTTQAAEIFTNANLANKETAEYNIRENWAINRATYGANSNRSYFELRLNEANLLGNPSSVAVVNPGEVSEANQTIMVENLYKQSFKITDKNILPVLGEDVQDVALPSAGYVNIDDVDIRVFDYDDLTEIVNNIEDIRVGTSIWVAKSNSYDWNVYRTNLVRWQITQVRDNLNGRCTLTFSGNHGLRVGDRLIVKYFNTAVDGAYEVKTVPTLKTLTIDLSLPDDVTSLAGNGLGFVLETVRVAQPSAVADLSYSNSLVPGNQAWVDNDGTGHWAVYQKQDPFENPTSIQPFTTVLNNQFGSAVAQGFLEQGALVGAPGYNSGTGAVYTYNKSTNVNYIETGILAPATTDVEGFGSSISAGSTDWGVVGASASETNRGYAYTVKRDQLNGNYLTSQIFVDGGASSEFGYSVAISRDERWMYISAPGEDTVYCYNRVDVQNQSLNFVGDGETITFPVGDTIKVDNDSSAGGIASQQIGVTVNNLPREANVDWEYNDGNVIFTVAPNTGDTIRVTRLQSKTFFPDTPSTVFQFDDLYTVTDIYSFSVYVNDVLQRPTSDYTFDDVNKTITFGSGVFGTVLINASSHWKLIDSITVSAGDSTGINFGYNIATTTDGRQIIVGAPNSNAGDEQNNAGVVYIFDRSVERFQVTDTDTREYTVRRTPNGPVTVKLNRDFLTLDTFNNNGEFSVVGNDITIDSSVTLNIGDVLEIETNTFKLIQSIESNNVQQAAEFGKSVDQCRTNCSVYIGMPKDSSRVPEGGSVERWTNQNRLYGTITGTVADPTLTVGNTIRINNYDVELTGTTVASLVQDIIDRDIPNVTASVESGKLKIDLVDNEAGDAFIKLVILPGEGDAFYDLGLTPYAYTQTINSPVDVAYGHFGDVVKISDTAVTLLVGAPDSTAAKPTTFDEQTTSFDSGSTEYVDLLPQSGVVYTFDFLPSVNANVSNPGKFAFGQQIFDETLTSLDKFGSALSYVGGILWIGAPNDDLDDSSGDFGRVSQLTNIDRTPAWAIEYREQDIVDARLINTVFTYDRVNNSITQYLDYIDPTQGKILGAARQNIDYIIATDPAKYNVGTSNNNGQIWDDSHVGEVWWDLTTVRFIDYHQDTLEYKARRWGQLFPGSSVDVYQWIESDVPPVQYAGEGTPYSVDSYVVGSKLEVDGSFNSKYYFWVRGITSVATQKYKTLSVNAIAQYIENPRSSGIAYIAALTPSTVALYNCRNLIGARDTILHIEFDKQANNDNVHTEYDLITDGNKDSFLGDGLYRKMLDSFCGVDTVGNLVPDAKLSIADKYGVEFRPRQSFFVDRFLALENYITRANAILAQFPVSEGKSFALLNSEEPEPTSVSGQWDKRLETYAELTYQDLATVPVGYRYLVASDSENGGLWTIYTVLSGRTLLLTRVQNYDTKQFWSYTDWIQPGYNASVKPSGDVETYSDLLALNVAEGTAYKVNSNSFGKFEIYQYTSGEWTRVVLEDGTITLSSQLYNYTEGRYGFDVEVFDTQRFDQNPTTETRQILKSLNEEIFTGDLLIYRNELLILVFEYIMTEQQAPDWLFKTSLIDVDHKIRDLETYSIYKQDNQDFVLDYIKEVKPYHVKIKEFNLRYEGNDTFDGTLTDFDLPAYYDNLAQRFVSPVLSNNEDDPDLSARLPSWSGWSTLPWNQWYNNYLLSLASVSVVEGGSGYTVEPVVTVTGTATRDAVLRARINTAGQVIEIEVVDAGEGYSETPVITITGGNGSGAVAVPIMSNSMIRSFDTTIKYDRYEYTSSVQNWQANTKYEEGSLVRYNGKVYSVNEVVDSSELDSGSSFDPDFYTEVDASTLSGIDRTFGLYDPDARDPGRELALLIGGIEYPGVQVQGPGFNRNTGFDVGNFDADPFDNIDIGPEGFPTYSDEILDTVIQGSFTDTYLGRRDTDVNIEGGEFIDTYSSHAPQELVPGSVFDTLSLKVYTRPGADWSGNGHGFDLKGINIEYDSSIVNTVDYSGYLPVVVAINVFNRTTHVELLENQDFTVNWKAQTITIDAGASNGDTIEVYVYSPGGGNQLFRNNYSANEINSLGKRIVFPVDYPEIEEMLIVRNGQQVSSNAYTVDETGISEFSQVIFNSSITFEENDDVVLLALGQRETGATTTSWSYPVFELFTYDGSTQTFDLSNSLQGTNEIDLVVERNGRRLRPAETKLYTADGSSAGPYYLPTRGEVNHGLVSEADVKVYVDGVQKFVGLDWSLSVWDGSSDRYIEFVDAPDVNSKIKVAITTEADYVVDVTNKTLTLRVGAAVGASIGVITWNDTREQDLLTQVFQGPTVREGVAVQEPFDNRPFDSATANDTPGSFDYTTGTVLVTNELDLGFEIIDSERCYVHKNGFRLSSGNDFTISGTTITIAGGTLGPGDVVTVTTFTQNVTPDGLQFQIFQDMLGNQKISRLKLRETPFLSRTLEEDDTVIHVTNARELTEPQPESGIFGVVSIEGERITYRERDVVNNTLSGLRRGVAGTAIARHVVGGDIFAGLAPFVRDESPSNQLPQQYQKTIYSDTEYGDGTNKTFRASTVVLDSGIDSTEIEEAVRVRVGGTELDNSEYTITQTDPVEVELVDAPADGVEVYIYIVKAHVMYAQGTDTASNGIALQEQQTKAAIFLRKDR